MTADFNRQTVEIIAKRAGSHCSNPDCFAVTAGPSEEEARAVNVGEAAHIYGARPGAARYSAVMSVAERSDITNAIWLCRNCHKIADADPIRFPAELLFEWRRAHEQIISESLGKAGAVMRQKILQRMLAGFENCSYLAQQIIIDKPDYWEYKLTAELLRTTLVPIVRRWEALEKGLYVLPPQVVRSDDYLAWSNAQMEAMQQQTTALTRLVSEELAAAWGPPGQPGSASEIHRVCSLIAEACQGILSWEEAMRFAAVPSDFQELQKLFASLPGRNMQKILEIPNWLSGVLTTEAPEGLHSMTVVFDLPPNWSNDLQRATERVLGRLQERN
ncbi:hypothetical protein [Reyranella sp.]|uniref:hypothetical protein n=1 Tax=Reyranella sp. TaxID=1929291 RepID=UPI003D0FE9B5